MFDLNPSLVLAGVILAAVQLVAALPWLWATDPKAFARTFRSASGLASVGLGLLAAGAVIAALMGYKSDSAGLEWYGRYGYGAVLHLQLLIGLFLLLPRLVVAIWPKGGAVAYAAYREACRQPMFWLIVLAAKLLIVVSVFIPYFTFGDDYKMMKQIGFDVVMLAAVLFGVLASSMSISEEIEGRTAVTLMSKPVNRRQFLIGKFLGILLACLIMTLLIAWTLNYALRAMPEFDKINEVVDPMPQQAERTVVPAFESLIPAKAAAARVVARGAGTWFADTLAHSLGLLLGFGQVMILVAIASALATRLPFVVNLVLCLVIYFLGHLAPVVVAVAGQPAGGGTAGLGLVGFLAQLFNVILPALEFFNMGPAIIRESPLDLWQFGGYVLTVFGYSVLYTAIALLVGLLLFEDRDLA
jgi:ABC-type transport system involved in multi-copper enzyme maturation permease subunit